VKTYEGTYVKVFHLEVYYDNDWYLDVYTDGVYMVLGLFLPYLFLHDQYDYDFFG
jgi:hypothetical protein